jgi:hypothetical protein
MPLFSAWLHDPALSLGEFVFALWFLATVIHWSWPQKAWSPSQAIFVLAAGALLFLGILGELQALIYLALVCLLCVPARVVALRILFACSSILWMPLWAWSMGPYLGSSLGVVSFGLALWLAVFSVAKRCFL